MEAVFDEREAVPVAGAQAWSGAALRLRAPVGEDGPAVTRLVADCPPLDPNSSYCNLLQCDHFADTCVVAEIGGRMVGWISAYRPPSDPGAIFVWQVAVHESARSQGLGGRMLAELMRRPCVRDAARLTTTVTEANQASMAMFAAFARRHGMEVSRTLKFDRDRHFEGRHDAEWQLSIGPLPTFRKQRQEVE
jgi:L-2,4-diaminobutyric acid acetyltransferase